MAGNQAGNGSTAEINPVVSLPVIDLGRLRGDDASVRAQIARELREAAEEWGFFHVVNHSVPEDLQLCMHERARKFFGLPLEEEIIGPNQGLRVSRALSASGIEWIFVDESLANSLDYPTTQIWMEEYGPSSNIVQEYCVTVEALGCKILELLAESLGVRRDFYSRHFRNAAELNGTWQLDHFPPNLLPFDEWRTVAHSDPSVLTLCKQDLPGLQLQKPRGSVWMDVKPVPGSYLVNVGDILEAWSNARFRSPEHRVIAPQEDNRQFSMVVYLDPPPSCHIEAPRELIDHEHPVQFVPFRCSDFRTIFDEMKRSGNKSRGKALHYFLRSAGKREMVMNYFAV